ncbi:MAG: hypothetical protein AB8F95_16070 [Bacteroidia bacterium]
MRFTKNTQDKLTDILRLQGFTIRYEKGNFQGGHCVVMDQRMIILNKFFPLESKINTLAEVIRNIDINPDLITDDQAKIVKKLKKEKIA